MKQNIFALLKLILFWLLLFALQRTVFLLCNISDLDGKSFGLIITSYWFALGMDISTSCYLILIPILLIIPAMFFVKNNAFLKIIHVINIILIVSCIMIGIFDIGLYSAWGNKINGKAISYLFYPKEAMMSFASVPYFLFLVISAVEIFIAVFIYGKWIRNRKIEKVRFVPAILFFVVAVFLVFTGIRGGFQKYPINKGWVYYSKYQVLNYAALNGFWNFMEIFINPGIKDNPYKYFSEEKADAIVSEMYKTSSDSSAMVLNTTRPNIVLILLESVSAECSGKLGGINGLMPGFDSLCNEGLLFKKFYATGFRTEQGLISYLSCFPAQPKTTIMRQFGKFEKLPSFTKILGENKYSLNYYYSGNLEFANTGTYLVSSGFGKIIGADDYAWKKRTDWGAYDEELFTYQLNEAANDSVPFFSIIMTSTNHEPFDADVEKIYSEGADADGYKNCVHYTDKCLLDYLKKAKEKSWYKNTLFILTADHAHSCPYGRKANEVERHWIPLLFYGDALKVEYKGKTNEHVGSQTDLAATLLSQLKIDSKSLKRSINMLNRYSPQFAFYTFENGFGLVTPEQSIIYDCDMGQIVYRKNALEQKTDDSLLTKGKAYLQQMFEEYIELNQ
jgi:phosphoglycerol transferase MdoB-like AlkP superfamily enzyme